MVIFASVLMHGHTDDVIDQVIDLRLTLAAAGFIKPHGISDGFRGPSVSYGNVLKLGFPDALAETDVHGLLHQ